jgi:glycosyltransferase involved in cell wall biosynthesis
MPMVATDVGGIGEIFGPYRHRLIPCDDVGTLADRLAAMLALAPAARADDAEMLAQFVATRFTLSGMAEGVIEGYREAIARRSRGAPTHASFAYPS